MTEEIFGILVVLIFYCFSIFYFLYQSVKQRKLGNPLPFQKLIRFVKISALVFTSTTVGFSIIYHTNYLDYQKPMGFGEYDQITFKNFRGLEFFRKTLYGNNRFAYIFTSIEYDVNEDNISIESIFHPSRSFVYNNHSNSNELLDHEKYHFKITELYVRKMKKDISALKVWSADKVEAIIDSNKEKEMEFQKKYDEDTFHSYIFGEQKKYETKIDSLLNLLSAFSKSKINLNEKN